MSGNKGNGAAGRFRPLRVIIAVVIALILIVGIYVAYVFLSYKRIPDNENIEVLGGSKVGSIKTGEKYRAVSFNIGFGAYEPDYSFFMDGGTESWAWSKERLSKNMEAMTEYLRGLNADLYLFQEVDKDATRTYHIDETEYFRNSLGGSSVFAVNWDSPYLFYPLTQPHGKSYTGILTLSSFGIESALRRQVPVEDSAMKIIDLDRCYSKSCLPVEGSSAKLLLYNVHLSAYTSDGSVADRQLEQLAEDMAGEYNNGNYVICGGDFNKDLLGDSSKYFGVSGEEYSWAKPLKTEVFEGKPLRLIYSSNAPSNRNADAPVNPEQFKSVIDGFIVSDNVDVSSNTNLDTGFRYSDHNPVTMEFTLLPN